MGTRSGRGKRGANVGGKGKDDTRIIMLAEDHDDLREVLQNALRLEANWNVVAMPRGINLLKAAWSVVPDLVILDVAMPDLDGLDTFRLLRQHEATREVPVLFVTANPGRLAGMPLQGPCDLLAKPFDIDDFVARVAALLSDNKATQSGTAGSAAAKL